MERLARVSESSRRALLSIWGEILSGPGASVWDATLKSEMSGCLKPPHTFRCNWSINDLKHWAFLDCGSFFPPIDVSLRKYVVVDPFAVELVNNAVGIEDAYQFRVASDCYNDLYGGNSLEIICQYGIIFEYFN